MAAAEQAEQEESAGSNGTLGGLLYADTTKTPVFETDWVALVESMAMGDQHALRSLYDRTNRLVFTLIVRITNNRETAEEVTLDVFHDLWRRASTYDAANGSVVGWIMNQARSRAIDRLRFEQRKKRTGHYSDVPVPAAGLELHEAVDLRDQARLLRNALAVLTPDEREAIEIAYFSELPYSQVATRLNQPLGTVKSRIRSGLQKLRHALGGKDP